MPLTIYVISHTHIFYWIMALVRGALPLPPNTVTDHHPKKFGLPQGEKTVILLNPPP